MRLVKIEIYGLVQGVGFRPFVYQLATNLGLNGIVLNDSSGVKIELSGELGLIDEFIKSLKTKLPPLARIDKIVVSDGCNIYSDFKIISSKDSYKFAPILPDFAICDECKNELLDSSNYRYNHPFINCTNCGPRFSLIKGLPYDRANTTMGKFKMCNKCKAEYKDPLNRRYHAQPIACKNCGPSLSYKDMSGNILSTYENGLKDCVNAIKDGKIVAIKGVGGFHLVCDALNHQAISTLRARKNRPDKPFAIMCKDMDMAKKYAYIDESEARILNSNLKPIVLLKSKDKLPDIIAKDIGKIGIFLPPTPLHILLLNMLNSPVIATSANLSKEPIIKDYETLKDKLRGVCDFALDNDRQIVNPSDDSICFALDEKAIYLRTSRGLKPSILPLNLNGVAPKGCFLALGALMKNQFAIYKDGLIFSSVYIGDMGSVATKLRFDELLESFKSIYGFEFDFVLGDAHPHFGFIDDFAKSYEIHRVYHHHAHALSVMLENGISNDVIALSFDGTGYGRDSTIWGGEILRCSKGEFDRIMHFDSFDLIGGDKAIKNIYYLAYAIAKKYSLNSPKLDRLIPEIQKDNLDKILKNQINTIKCSSLGRIFDAFASIIFGLKSVSYDAQAPMMVEALYDESLDLAYEFSINDGIISYENAFKKALVDEPRIAATAFINGLANLSLEIASSYNLPIVLCGGVWQNRALLKKTIDKFKVNQIEYYLPINEPMNDSAIAMGQIYFGLNMLRYNDKF
ncbi:carbamoyltransferase HypF [Campylobacter sp. CX2-4080-23]|uniref:carbamoyltransferase HypF n=1 Tax=Campylobacter porcelli TaxID=1660073 RepID=UPI002EA84B3F|nr:carbamoyltransferase HypF [Campylobacter sp. CX2-4080-23]